MKKVRKDERAKSKQLVVSCPKLHKTGDNSWNYCVQSPVVSSRVTKADVISFNYTPRRRHVSMVMSSQPRAMISTAALQATSETFSTTCQMCISGFSSVLMFFIYN